MFKTPLFRIVNLMNKPDVVTKLVDGDVILTPVARFLFSNIVDICNDSVQKFDKVKFEKINEYGTLNQDSVKEINESNPNLEKFQSEMQEVLEAEVEFNVRKIKATDVNVSMKEQFLINWMLEE